MRQRFENYRLEEINRWENLRQREDLKVRTEDPIIIPGAKTVIDLDEGRRHKDAPSMYEDFMDTWAVGRLHRVKQLGIANKVPEFLSLHHTRYNHSLLFACEIDFIAQRHDLDRELAVSAAFLHDIATPPLSDSTAKGINSLQGVEIDDEENFREVLEKSEEAKKVLNKYGVDHDELEEVVKGESDKVIGQLVNGEGMLNVDRWSYLKKDGQHAPDYREQEEKIEDPFESLKIIDGEVVFENFRAVDELLKLGLDLFQWVYGDGQLEAREAFFGEVAKEMWKQGELDKENLYKLTDDEFEYKMKKFIEEGDNVDWADANEIFGLGNFFKTYGVFDAKKSDVEEKLDGLTEEFYLLGEDFSADPATETRIYEDGQVKKYKDFKPRAARVIEEGMKDDGGVRIYGKRENEELERAVSELEDEL